MPVRDVGGAVCLSAGGYRYLPSPVLARGVTG